MKGSKSGILYIVITILLGFSAVNTGNNLLFLVVSGLLAFMSVTGMAGMYNIRNLRPRLEPPDEIFAGTAAPFRLVVENRNRYLPSFLIRLECQAGHSLTFPMVPAQSSADGIVMLTFGQRGLHPAGRVSISSQYPVGFFTRYWTFEIGSSFTVFPHPRPAAGGAGGEDAPRTGAGFRRDRGMDGELERIYPYTGAEPLRLIHWKLSARSSDLQVKGFGAQSSTPLLVDVARLPGPGIEERLSQAAWLVRRWIRERPVGLLLDGRTIPPECGRHHSLRLLTELAVYGRG